MTRWRTEREYRYLSGGWRETACLYLGGKLVGGVICYPHGRSWFAWVRREGGQEIGAARRRCDAKRSVERAASRLGDVS